MIDLIAHLTRQAAFSRATFGPGPRTKGVIDHIRKELREVEKEYPEGYEPTPQHHENAAEEWLDVATLAYDGLLRALWTAHPRSTADVIAKMAAHCMVSKQGTNELRDWPDWRTASEDHAIEHDRSGETPTHHGHNTMEPEKIRTSTNAIIVYGPQACGKTHNADRLREFFMCEGVFDGYNPYIDDPIPGRLHLTNYDFDVSTYMSMPVIPYHVAKRLMDKWT